MTSEYMNVQKSLSQINRLEKKVKEEEHGFDKIDEYNADKLTLDNLKAEMNEDAKANVETQLVMQHDGINPADFGFDA